MSGLKMIQQSVKSPTQTLTVRNITERERRRIISMLHEEYDFLVSDKKDYILRIEDIRKCDLDNVINIINKVDTPVIT